jgi:hypothetical protein
LSEEQKRQRIRELVRKKTGLDWPELEVGEIEKAMSSVTLFYWCKKKDIGKRWIQKQLELTDEEAESIIGANRSGGCPNRDEPLMTLLTQLRDSEQRENHHRGSS